MSIKKIVLFTLLILLTEGFVMNPPVYIPKYTCTYQVNGNGQLEKVCGWN